MSIGPSIGIIGGIAAVPAVQRGVASDAASTETARQQGEIKTISRRPRLLGSENRW